MTIIWNCCENKPEVRVILEDMLPNSMVFQVIAFDVQEHNNITVESKFFARMFMRGCTEEHVKEFLTKFGSISHTTHNMFRGDTKGGKKYIVSGTRKCHHSVRKRVSPSTSTVCDDKEKGKQTHCESKIGFKILNHDHNDKL